MIELFSLTKLSWLKEVFLSADKSGDGLLSVDEVFALMRKLNVKISYKKLRDIFKVSLLAHWASLSFSFLVTFARPSLKMEMRNLCRI